MDSIGRLAGGVAHDFNNMLSVIMGHAELALSSLEPTDAVRQDIQEIQKAAARSAELTRQLLAFARRQPIAPRLLDLNGAIEASLRMLRRLIGEDVTLEWRPDPQPWPVRLDPSQLDQLLTNLVVNARDAIAGVGEIRIATDKVTLPDPRFVIPAAGAVGEFAAIEVTDTGAGMDAETLAHAFEPFFTTKEEGKGTGLGLATVYGIVRQNGGFVALTSEVGRGTSARLLLPRVEPTADERATARGEDEILKQPGGSERILLVEDERAVRELARQMLERLGYTVSAAATPGEALELVRGGPQPSLALLDVVMPEMNGVELSRRLMTAVPSMRYLFFSAYPADVVTNRGLIPETAPFLAKPFSARDLARKVREVLDTR
jgi:two-component system cell cycle sensor histidine kinase/response regulator CckA